MKKLLTKTILPLFLISGAVFIIGSGCNSDPATAEYNFWPDIDQDGFGDASVSGVLYTVSGAPSNYVRENTDCDDGNVNINPNATEVPDNDVDDNCDNLVAISAYPDLDGDGFGSGTSTVIEIMIGDDLPNGFVANNLDCNDNDSTINPLADDIENNGIDENCDGADIVEIYADNDGDGYGIEPALAPPAVGVQNKLDCDDSNPNINPLATEIPNNGIDENCDGADNS